MDPKFIELLRSTYPDGGAKVTLGAAMLAGEVHPEPRVSIPLAMLNRHGLIAGATGTGKTRTLQLVAEQLSAAGVPVFLSDIKGDVSGIGEPGVVNDRITTRAQETGYSWTAAGFPIELLSLTGKLGAQLRATVSSFGPLLLAKVLRLNETQTSVLTMVFKYCDDRKLLLLDFTDVRAVLQHLSGPGAAELAAYGGMSKATVGVLLREMIELEHQGAEAFFGEPEFDLDDLMQIRDGRGLVSVLELQDVQNKPALFSTFMMWMLARLYAELPEVGDLERPKLVFFFDEAHLLFDGASKEFLAEVEKVIRLVRSKGVGIFFVTQNPRDVPADVLGQLGHRVQHALRAFTPDDEKALRGAARTYPRTEFYDVQQTLTSLGIGEALITVLSPRGVPTPPFATRLVPPSARMSPLTAAEVDARLKTSEQVLEYATAVDRESARELLAERATAGSSAPADEPRARPGRAADAGDGTSIGDILNSPMAKTIAGRATTQILRGVMGALLGTAPRRRTRRRSLF